MRLYVKYILSTCFSLVWVFVSIYLSIPWINEISHYVGTIPAWLIVTGISLIPGMALSFIGFSLYIDNRPKFKSTGKTLPPVSILIAAYNEEECIYQTIYSIFSQSYKSPFEIIIVDDGSTDKTVFRVNQFKKNFNAEKILLIENEKNKGKALVLNQGLEYCKYDLVVTIDADSIVHKNSLQSLISVINESDEDYAAVAGTILCKNHNKSFMSSIQYWDYLVGISSVKRIQSMYQGTLVAQGAFSVYKTKVLRYIGGWPDKIGEDIVLTWNLLDKDYKVGHAEDAICFTNVPETYRDFYKQRKRWSRGMIEAFFSYPKLLFKRRKSTFFIWYNLFFPFIDFTFLFVFLPGVLAALIFKFYLIAGIVTILQIPLAILFNLTIYFIQKKTLENEGIQIPTGMWLNSLIYITIYQLLMTPATLDGYWSELRQKKKTWNDE